ncbi:hypothetical protein IVB16_27330 [Bradyrhizobium sp. 183]|nr:MULTISPECIES: hypothetical protein [unclassified Bradyrhizobium]UPJ78563.1 hypothetical protein IVB17_27330 [Bradyrhizobium sp. 184]UPJ86358.1 hypothetical protein IVB16_27330 [Bradyrhizobium sp. 183]
MKVLKIAATVDGLAGAIWLGINIYNAKPMKCIAYLEDWCVKKVVDQ